MVEVEGRVVLIGEARVGKTSLIHQFLDGDGTVQHEATAGATFHSSKMTIFDRVVSMQIWDTAGQERYRALGPIYYRKSVGAIAVFDLTSRDSMKALELWVSTYRENADDPFIVIAANKCDLTGAIALTMEETTEWATKLQAECIWTSALTGEGVEAVFGTIARHLLHVGHPPRVNTSGSLSHSVKVESEVSICC
jgi:small GTP-binding protein